MKKLILIALSFICGIASSQNIRTVNFGQKVYIPGGGGGGGSTSTDGSYTFTLGSSARVSAGVFKNDTVLVRTLLTTKQYTAGSHTEYWDGRDDYGNLLPNVTGYKIKVKSNNVQYVWQGTVGNSSDNMTGVNKYKGYQSYNGLTFTSSNGYYCTGYSEGFTCIGKFALATPNTCTKIFYGESIVGDIKFNCNDGTRVYWSAQDSYANSNTFVFATNVSNDAETSFTSGASYAVTHGKTYSSVISHINTANSEVTGMAVGSTYLFVARGALNNLYVLNKTTGALVQTLGFTNVRSLTVDGADKLWILYSTNTIQRYTVNGDGTLTSIGTLTGPIAAQSVSYGNSLIAVCDGGTSQQVKFYNYTTNALVSTKGTAGGYQTNSTVNLDKFMFSDVNKSYNCFVAWQTDNSYWMNDQGNFRTLHFNSAGTYINRVEFPGNTYSSWADKNDITRVFTGYIEYAIDYSVQTLTGSTGWTLLRNWGAMINSTTYNDGAKTIKPLTLSNGRTYSLINRGTDVEVVELVNNGIPRFTGIMKTTLTGDVWFLCEDGSLQVANYTTNPGTLKRYGFAGFIVNDPTWNTTPETLSTVTQDDTQGNPANVYWTRSNIMSPFNKIVWFDPSPNATGTTIVHSGYHVGIVQRGSNDVYIAQTERSTHRNYKGPYPPAGWFDVGNDVSDFAGGNANWSDHNFITSYHGEFWKQMQANQFNHYWDDGLAVGQFGTNRYIVGLTTPAAAGMAGNALTPIVVKDVAGDLYLYHGDESDHCAVHRWKISGLNTISDQVIPTNFPITYNGTKPYTDLMAGLPFDAEMPDGVGSWTRIPSTNIDVAHKFVSRTSKQSYDKTIDNDISTDFNNNVAGTDSISRHFNPGTLASPWTLYGQLGYPGNNVNIGTQSIQIFIELLDASNKVMTSMYLSGDGTNTYFKANNVDIVSAPGFAIDGFDEMMDFSIHVVSNSSITFQLANYAPVTTSISDASANWQTPRTFRIRFVSYASGAYGNTFDVKNLRFKPN